MTYILLSKSKIQFNYTIFLPKQLRTELEKKTGMKIRPGLYFVWKKDKKTGELLFEIKEEVETT